MFFTVLHITMMAPAKQLTTMLESAANSAVPGLDMTTAPEVGVLEAVPERAPVVPLLWLDLVTVADVAADVELVP